MSDTHSNLTSTSPSSGLSKEQQYAFDKYCQGKNLFVTGPGGTGKTKLIHDIVNHAIQVGTYVQVCAMTGCAATLLGCKARTIHSWAGIGIAKGARDKIVKNALTKNRCKKIRKTRLLIVDEVSMMSVKIFEIIEEIARIARKNSMPFGGMQIIFTGDFFQLPPISTAGESDTELFCFESERWTSVFPIGNHIELKTMFRQSDPLYISILQDIRKGKISAEHKNVLFQYINRPYNKEENGGIVPTKIFPIKSRVESVNTHMFTEIDSQEYSYTPSIQTNALTYVESGALIPKDVLEECAKLTPTEMQREVDYLLNNTTGLKEELKLKVGCSVMCTCNLDLDRGICNGSQGVVVGFVDRPGKMSLPIVQFANGIKDMVMNMHYWQSDEYPSIIIGQIPLVLSWAMTIHKIQGATLAMAEMDIGRSIFEYGQIYVALSRVKSLDGLYLIGFNPSKIKANPRVLAFYEKIPEVPDIPDVAVGPSGQNSVLDFEEYAYKEEDGRDGDKDIKKIMSVSNSCSSSYYSNTSQSSNLFRVVKK
jgi:ATP-dependent DNA helicase PIF1